MKINASETRQVDWSFFLKELDEMIPHDRAKANAW
ncbi:hypothetical protein Mal15_24750 [Stieleria maiorica]|uniref:Uncharacterized protein n=1 Tax=Stieleria maiorica TaxID=2795974 RepID=A0A5B9MCD1_9BACT|nr:hypothetical protein Mal15_24750 [Stieleria maiorica]